MLGVCDYILAENFFDRQESGSLVKTLRERSVIGPTENYSRLQPQPICFRCFNADGASNT